MTVSTPIKAARTPLGSSSEDNAISRERPEGKFGETGEGRNRVLIL
jgi:hypothetical protein